MSGEITRTPDLILTSNEKVTNDKLNRLGGGTFQVNPGSITNTELSVELTGGFGNVNDLRNNTDSFTDNTAVYLSGYYTDGDGDFGPPLFVDTSDAVTADDGFTCIVDANGVRYKRSFNTPINIKWAGAVTTAAADNTATINLCIATGKRIFIPEGTFEYSGLIDLEDERTLNGESHGASVLKANHADARLNVSSNSHVHDLRIDGNDIAEFGMIVQAASSGAYIEHVRILNHTEGGLVLDGAQNSTFLSMKISNNKRNVAFANDARNNALFGVQTRYSGATIPSHADNRHIWAGTWSHAKLVATPPYGGNTIMRNLVIGGVFESEHGNDYAVEFVDGGLAGHGWSFFQTEFTSYSSVTAIIKVSTNFATTCSFTDCKFEGGYAFEIGADQVVKANNCDYTGGGAEGKWLGDGHVILGVDQLDVGFNILGERDETGNTIFQYGIGDWVASGTATVAYNGTTKVMDITSPSTTGNSGAKTIPARFTTVVSGYDDRCVEVKLWVENNLAQRAVTAMDNSAETLTLDTTDWNVNTDFSVGDAVTYVEGDSAIGGLTNGNTYYIESVSTTAVTLSETLGGSAIDLTGTLPSGTHYLRFVDPPLAVQWSTFDGVSTYGTRTIGYAVDGFTSLGSRLQGDEIGIQIVSQKLGGQSWSMGMLKTLVH